MWTLAIFRGHKQRTLAEKPSVHAGIVLLSLIFLATQTTRHELQKFKTVLFCEKNHDQKLAKPHGMQRPVFDPIRVNGPKCLIQIPDETEEIAHRTIGVAIEVHRRLGPGFLESVYEEALAIEMKLAGLDFTSQHPVSILYRDQPVGETRLDFLVKNQLILELKACDAIHPIHKAQVLSYLRATGLHLGLLINFNVPILRDGIKRIII